MSFTVFKDVTLLDCTGREPIYPAAVVVENGVIEEVIEGNPHTFPSAEIVDCHGSTLMPGLIDAHIHLNLFDTNPMEQIRHNLPSMIVIKCLEIMEDTLMQGFTTALDAGGVDAGFKAAQSLGLIKGPRMQVCGHFLSQSGGHGDIRLSTEITPPASHYLSSGIVADGVSAVRKAAREELRMGADYVKVMAAGGCASPADEPDTVQYSLEELRAAAEEADSVGKICIAHCYSPRSIQRCIEAGVKRIEHGNFMDRRTAEIMKAMDTLYVPTIATYDIMARKGKEFGIPDYFHRKMKVANERAEEALKLAFDVGLTIGSGSDMVGPGQPFKANELELQSRVMGSMGAILAATKVNSEILNISNIVGTIERGKIADILIVEGNPLDDITLFQTRDKIRIIMQEGNFIKKTI